MKNIVLLPFLLLIASVLSAQTIDPKFLLGRWEVRQYAEQGLQVDKKQDPLSQAVAVYRYAKEQRTRFLYGYDLEDMEEMPKRRAREMARWAERDSAQEVRRVAEAIATPYYVVFFADSTMSTYNKGSVANSPVLFPEASHYVFSARTNSLHIGPATYGGYVRWHAQVLALSAMRMTLFLAEEGEVVELEKTEYKLP